MSADVTTGDEEPTRARPRDRPWVDPRDGPQYESPEKGEGRAWEAAPLPGTYPEDLLDIARRCYDLRIFLDRDLFLGKGDEKHPDLVRMRTAMSVAGSAWGHAPEDASVLWPRHRVDADSPASTLNAALAVSTVLEEGDRFGRRALLARVRAVRAKLGWDEATSLGRDVVDQYAISVAHADVARWAISALNTRPETEPVQNPFSDVMAAFNAKSGLTVTPPATDEFARRRKAWLRRLQRAEAGVKKAARLVKHAQKVGWIVVQDGKGSLAARPVPKVSSVDPLLPLAAPEPEPVRPPLRGMMAEIALEDRLHADALQAAWPPPEWILESELEAEPRLWDATCYAGWVRLDGKPRPTPPGLEDAPPGDLWCRFTNNGFFGPHETPEQAYARLAEWAPDYADPEVPPPTL